MADDILLDFLHMELVSLFDELNSDKVTLLICDDLYLIRFLFAVK